MNKTEHMYSNIEQHGANLNAIFKTKLDDWILVQKLLILEQTAHKLSTDYCNGVVDYDEWDIKTDKLLEKLDKIIGYKAKKVPCFINGDARGYALKIKSEYCTDITIHRDWGGYGILAPDFKED